MAEYVPWHRPMHQWTTDHHFRAAMHYAEQVDRGIELRDEIDDAMTKGKTATPGGSDATAEHRACVNEDIADNRWAAEFHLKAAEYLLRAYQ